MDDVQEDLKPINVRNWKRMEDDRAEWRRQKVRGSEEKEKNIFNFPKYRNTPKIIS